MFSLWLFHLQSWVQSSPCIQQLLPPGPCEPDVNDRQLNCRDQLRATPFFPGEGVASERRPLALSAGSKDPSSQHGVKVVNELQQALLSAVKEGHASIVRVVHTPASSGLTAVNSVREYSMRTKKLTEKASARLES